MRTKKIKSVIFAIGMVVLLVGLDQAAKLLADLYLNPQKGGSDFVIWEGVFRLHYLENRGAAFGLLQGQKLFLVLITAVVFVVICFVYMRLPFEKRFLPARWLAVFIMAGAIGNFIDRMLLGYVIDFFYFELINFPVFNVADIYVTCSVIVFVALFLLYYKETDLERIFPSRKRKA